MRRWNAKAYVINEKMKYPCDKCDCDVKLMKSWIYGIQAVKKRDNEYIIFKWHQVC